MRSRKLYLYIFLFVVGTVIGGLLAASAYEVHEVIEEKIRIHLNEAYQQ